MITDTGGDAPRAVSQSGTGAPSVSTSASETGYSFSDLLRTRPYTGPSTGVHTSVWYLSYVGPFTSSRAGDVGVYVDLRQSDS